MPDGFSAVSGLFFRRRLSCGFRAAFVRFLYGRFSLSGFSREVSALPFSGIPLPLHVGVFRLCRFPVFCGVFTPFCRYFARGISLPLLAGTFRFRRFRVVRFLFPCRRFSPDFTGFSLFGFSGFPPAFSNPFFVAFPVRFSARGFLLSLPRFSGGFFPSGCRPMVRHPVSHQLLPPFTTAGVYRIITALTIRTPERRLISSLSASRW